MKLHCFWVRAEKMANITDTIENNPTLIKFHQVNWSILSPSSGSFARCRRSTWIQAPDTTNRQVDHPSLQPLQSSVGLAYPTAGHLHGHFHTLLCCLPPQWHWGAEEAGVRLLLLTTKRSGSDCGHHVHCGHSHKLQDHLRQHQWGSGQPPGQDCHPLF